MKIKIIIKEEHEFQTGDNTEVGIFFRAPQKLNKLRGSLGQTDRSPAHVTFLYIGAVDKENENKLIQIVQNELSKLPSNVYFELEQKIRYFKNGIWSWPAYQAVKVPKQIYQIRKNIKARLIENNIPVSDEYDIYKPHITRDYVDPENLPKIEPISYKWKCDNIEIWGLSQVKKIEFSKNKKIIKENNYVEEEMKIKIILKESVDNLFKKAQSIFHYILSEMKKYVNKSPNSKGVEIIKKDNTYYVKLECLNTNLLFVLSKGETATAHYSKIEENLHKIVMTTPNSSWTGIAELESVFIHEFTHFYENLMRKKSIFDDRKISHKTEKILKKYNIPKEVWLDAFAEPEINAFLTEFFEKLIQQVRYDMYKGDLESEISAELWSMKKSGRIILLKDFEEIILRYLKFTFEKIRQNYVDKTTENVIPIDLYFKILFSLRPVRMRKKKVINKLIKFITGEYAKYGSHAYYIKGNDIQKRVGLNENQNNH